MRASALTRAGVLTGVVDCVVVTSTTVAVPVAGATGGVSGAASSTGGGFLVALGVDGGFDVAPVTDGPVAGAVEDATSLRTTGRDGVAAPVTTAGSVRLVVPGGSCAATPGAG